MPGRKLSHLRPAPFDRFWFGAPYYPEHWTSEIRRTDAGRMAAAGFNIVRLAEFAWDMMEPEDGKFDFTFFDQTIADLAKHGIKTMLCTPTAAPPRWLTLKYPEILRVDAQGVTKQHGARQHCCTTHPVFREYSQKITRAMAEHFSKNPDVVSWQTDNEFHCHFCECHCPACQVAFRKFLADKFDGNIQQLNQAWGTAFWAQTYRSFDEIQTPRAYQPTYPNPAQWLDYCRFLSAEVSTFQHQQIEILRKANPDWWITHNGLFSNIDYRGKFTQDLDVLGYDVYPMFIHDPETRIDSQVFNLDRTRAWSGNFIIPEHQSGPGGQSDYYHNNPEPGEIRKMTYTSIARGADSLLYFRWRTCLFGAEEYWCGIIDHDNIPRRRYEEICQIGEELKRIGPAILGSSIQVDCAVATSDMDVAVAHQSYPMGLPSEKDIAASIHKILFRQNYAVGCVHPADELNGLKLYVIPHWALFDPAWLPNLENYVRQGGTLVIGARTATRDRNNNVDTRTIPGCLQELCGITIEEYGRINPGSKRELAIRHAGNISQVEHWYELIAPQKEEIEIIGTWSGRHLDDAPAVSLRRLDRGTVVYVGSYLDESLFAGLLPTIRELSGLKPISNELPHGIEVVLRENRQSAIRFYINHLDEACELPLLKPGINLITDSRISGKITLPRFGVAVIQEK